MMMLKLLLLALFSASGAYAEWQVECPAVMKTVSGSCVYIPCSFGYPGDISDEKGIDKIWYKDFDGNRKVVSHPRDPPDAEYTGRVEFLGDAFPKNCTVLMKALQKADEGTYNFRFEIIDVNKWADKRGVRLEVTDEILPPEVNVPPQITEGASVTFQCSSPYFCPDGSVSLNWQNYVAERSFTSMNVQLETNGVLMTQNLTTSFTWMENEKKILCAVSVRDKIAVKEITLNVTYSPKLVSVLIQPSRKNIKQGDSVTLSCQTNGSNPAISRYTWYKDGNQIASQPFLSFHSISKEDHGEYQCEAENAIGKTSSDIARLIVFSARAIVSPYADVKEGEPVTLTCEVLGVRPEEVHYSWWKNNIWIKEGSVRSLMFHEITSSDSGYYYCKVQNDLGSDTSPPITLNVIYPPRSPSLTSFLETQLGDMAQVRCTVDSNPFSDLTLYKNGIAIASTTSHGAPNQRLQVTSAKNYLNLAIQEVKILDKGTYSCLAKNAIGNSSASIQLTVELARVVVSPSADVEEGKEVRLTCAATRSSEEGSGYSWFKNDNRLMEDPEGNSLTFLRVSPQDAGSYYCRVHNKQGGSTSPPVTLHVLYSPRDLSVTSLVSSHDPLTAAIRCAVRSDPPSQLFLSRGGTLVASSLQSPSNKRYKVQSSANVLQLEILDVVMEDEGTYSCHANNSYGQTAGSLRFITPMPSIVVDPSTDVQEGDRVNLTCSLKSTSEGGDYTFSWYKNNALLEEVQDPLIQFASVSSSESGTYSCEARNNEISKTSAPVTMLVKYAPRHLQVRSFQDTKNGRSAFIRCVVESYPAAELMLYREDQLVASRGSIRSTNDRYTVSSSHNELSLNIHNIKMEDDGKYNCTALNDIGSISETLQFTVQTARVLASPSTEASEGERVTLTCDVLGSQLDRMEYIWYKNSKRLEKSSDRTLLFEHVKRSDSGVYHCLAKDDEDGSISPPVSLHVSYAPTRPVVSSFWEASSAQVGVIQCSVDSDPPSILAMFFKAVMIASSNTSESSGPRRKLTAMQNMLKVEIHQVMVEDEGLYTCLARNTIGESEASINFTAQTTRVLVSPSSVVREGHGVNMTCVVDTEHPDSATYTWYKNGNTYLSSSSRSLTFANVTSEDRGSYSCTIHSQQGSKSSQSVTLDIQYPPRNVRVKSFLDTENGKVIIILGVVDSNPPSEMSLYKDGQMLVSSTEGSRPSNRLLAYFSPDTMRLEIRGVKTSDQGTYVFVAKNTHGMSQGSVTFNVEGVHVLVKPSEEIEEGQSVMLTCDVMDSPEEVVGYTWYKNSRWLQEGALGSISFEQVSSSDAGSYACKANSIGGSSMTSPPISISVLYPPRNLSVTSFLELQERQLAVIICSVDSEPPSQLFLLRGKEVVSSERDQGSAHRVKLSPSRNSLRLEIKDIIMGDQGDYTCQANNSFGTSEKSIHFSVQTARMQVSPSGEIREGQSVTLTCQSPKTSNTSYTWYKNNRWLHESSQNALVLPRVSSSDTGSYHCLAKHQTGDSISPLVGISVQYSLSPVSALQAKKADSPYKITSWVAIVCIVLLVAGIIGILYWDRIKERFVLKTEEDSMEMNNKDTTQLQAEHSDLTDGEDGPGKC
ncbi:sialoadhesin isoform X2 [Hyperolius riggenbachi]|uniref:sialoadhesin isoform X2 n=1 Tax=Hyperolius riggenbachi TaxID=752182 RepID=UPI0035A29BC4